jgi:tRNA1(Val) A37 N6-methylase TrmN6
MVISIKKDVVLGKKITLFQPVQGYRAAIDPFFLAASCNVKPGDKVLDVGTGVGTVALILGLKEKLAHITGIDFNSDFIELAQKNATENNLAHLDFISSDIRDENILPNNHFDHVVSNPPFYDPAKHNVSTTRAQANMESVPLNDWLCYCIKKTHPNGALTLIHHADRLPEIVSYLAGKMGAVTVYPLWPNGKDAAKRIIVQGKKNSRGPFRLMQGLLLHKADGSYTDAASDILNGKRFLSLV